MNVTRNIHTAACRTVQALQRAPGGCPLKGHKHNNTYNRTAECTDAAT